MLSLLVSCLVIVTQLALSHAWRSQVATSLGGLWRTVAMETIAAAEMCATCFELCVVADNYGWPMYALLLFLLTIWWGHSWGEATACPYSLLEEYVEEGSPPLHLVAKVGAQVLGGVASFSWMKRLWQLELIATHEGRGVDACTADLHVTPLMGFCIEAGCTCLCRLVSRNLGKFEPRLASSVDSFFATSMVVLALDTSGGYFNPVLATGLKWGCHGHTNAQHVFVYWAGAITGSLLSLAMYRHEGLQRLAEACQKGVGRTCDQTEKWLQGLGGKGEKKEEVEEIKEVEEKEIEVEEKEVDVEEKKDLEEEMEVEIEEKEELPVEVKKPVRERKKKTKEEKEAKKLEKEAKKVDENKDKAE